MIVGFGSAPPQLLERLRLYVDDPRVLIYPEFFDAKRELIEKRYARYVEKVLAYRHRIVIALWPDYCHAECAARFGLHSMTDIVWVFPLHHMWEINFVLGFMDRVFDTFFVGYASQQSLRDYTIHQFIDACRAHGLPMWYLGANSREIYEAVLNRFDGVDVTTLSIPGWSYRDNLRPEAPKVISEWLRALANGVVLRSRNGRLVAARRLDS